MGENNFNTKEKTQALDTSLCALAQSMGYTPVRQGANKFNLKEMDSLMIYNDRTWCRFSNKSSRQGGTQIDFLLEFGNCNSVVEAVHELLSFQGIYIDTYSYENHSNFSNQERAEFVLPEKATSYRIAYAYPIKTRGLSIDITNYFVKVQKILYEDAAHHNLVFLGKDKAGSVHYATKRGTGDMYGRKFKGDVPGSDKNYGVNLVNENSDTLKVFEASIDCMSYMDVTGDYESNKVILGMLTDYPLSTFLEEHEYIRKINFCIDNDEPAQKKLYGIEAEINKDTGEVLKDKKIGLLEKYFKMGYVVSDNSAPKIPNVKDWNEYLKYLKKNEPEKGIWHDKEKF